jgi:hemolysin activation/secretion protein
MFAFTSLFSERVKKTDIRKKQNTLSVPIVDEKKEIDLKIKAIVLIGQKSSIESNDREGIIVKGVKLPGSYNDLRTRLQPFLDKEFTEKKTTEIKDIIANYYKDNKRPLVKVFIPQQEISSGILQIEIIESKIEKIEIKGNEWFSTKLLRKYIRLQEGENLDWTILNQDLVWMNKNPFRSVNAVFLPGEEIGTTDIEFWERDRLPFRIYAGADNTGIKATGDARLFTGFNLGNVFGIDHTFSYQFTTSTESGKFYSNTAKYTMPLPWRNILDIYGGYSWVSSKPIKDTMKNKGESSQVSLRYTIPLKPLRDFIHEFTWGLDYKKTNNNLFYRDLLIYGHSIVITQANLDYLLIHETRNLKVSFQGQIFVSPFRLFNDQSDSDYETLRTYAKSKYGYIRVALNPIFQLPHDFSLALNMRGEVSSANLISSEQLGLGGDDSVRGYEERVVNKDNTILLSTEVRTPPVSFIKKIVETMDDDYLQFLAFLDFGAGANHKKIEGEKGQYLIGIGPGLRYSYKTNVNIRIDWGYQLHKIKNSTDNKRSRFNLSLVLGY